MTLVKKTIGRVPQNFGDWDANFVNPKTQQNGYGQKFRTLLYGCEFESLMENNTYAPMTLDESENFVEDTTHWRRVTGNPEVWKAGQIKPATSEDHPYNGMGRVVLRKNMVNGVNTLTQDMFYKEGDEDTRVPNTNTVFVIQYEFTLGEDITVPENCVLEFEGGSINGDFGFILSKTLLLGNPQFDVNLTGTIKNSLFNVLWIKNGDIGYKINKSQENFKALEIPQGEFVFSTPVIIEGISILESKAVLKYDGVFKNNEGIFLIKRSVNATIRFNQLVPNDGSLIDYTDTREINAVGFELRSSNNNHIFIQNIGWFNENLRVSDILSTGCSYNHFFIDSLNNGNFNIRIYQHNSDAGGRSWCNENTFHSGRLTKYSSTSTYGDMYYIGIGGPAIDKESYKNNEVTDTYDGCNALTFMNMSVEDGPIILARNAQALSFILNREEGVSKWGKFIGSISIKRYISKYSENFISGDFSQAVISYIDSDVFKFEHTIDESSLNTLTADGLIIPDGHDSYDGSAINNNPRGNYLNSHGLIVDTSVNKLLYVNKKIKERLIVFYLDDDNQNITANYTDSIYQPFYSSFYSGIQKGWIAGGDSTIWYVKVPNEINKIFIGASFVFEDLINVHTVIDSAEVPDKIKRVGTTAERPIGLAAAKFYYDKDLGKPIWYKGNNTWVDATGQTV